MQANEVIAFWEALHKQQESRLADLETRISKAFVRWMCCPIVKRGGQQLSRHWIRCYMTYFSLAVEARDLKKKHESTRTMLAAHAKSLSQA